MGSDAGVAAPLLEAVPRWPFISADGQTGGFVRPGILQPVDPDRYEVSGVFAGALTGAPRRIACPPPASRRSSTTRRGASSWPTMTGTGPACRSSGWTSCTGRRCRCAFFRVPLSNWPGTKPGHGCWCWPPSRGPTPRRSGRAGAIRGRRPIRNSTRARPGPSSSGRWMSTLATASLLGPDTGSIWEFAVAPTARWPASTPTTRARQAGIPPFVARFDPAERSLRRLYKPQWQASHVTVEPGTGRIGFVEGWCSDRGLQSGRVVIMAADGSVERGSSRSRPTSPGSSGTTRAGCSSPAGRISAARPGMSVLTGRWTYSSKQPR